MKVFLIAGAVLMTGASIYGFIDYRKSSRNKNLTGLYKIQEPSTIVETKQPAVEIKEEAGKTTVEVKKDNKIVKKKIAKSVAAPVIKTENGIAGKMTINPVEPIKTETVANTSVTAKPGSIKKKKKLNYKLFSRAALDEEYIEREVRMKKHNKIKQ